MYGVAAEVAQKVIVLFQHDDLDPGAGQQQSVHYARGAAAGDTNLGLQNLRHALTLRRAGQPEAGTFRWARSVLISRSKSSADSKDRYTEANRR